MNFERSEQRSLSAKDFGFEVSPVDESGRVILRDGADQWIFGLRGGKVFVVGRPGERDVSKEKWKAMIAQAGAILGRIKEKAKTP